MLAALSAATLVCASSAQAQVVRLGAPDVPTTPATNGFACMIMCEEGFTLAQLASPDVDVAPASGVITGWRVDSFGPLALRVLEPTPSGWTGSGTSAEAVASNGEPNATELPVARGDLIGADLRSGALVQTEFGGPSTEKLLSWSTLLAEGGAGSSGTQDSEAFIQLSAEEELTPIVTSVSPASGSTAGGGTVTITGEFLDSARNVAFGSQAATTFSFDPLSGRITATPPASSAGTVDVHVINLHSTSETVAADRYTYVAPGPLSGPGLSGGGSTPAGAPVVTGFTESQSRWRRGSSLARASSTPVGTIFTFVLNEPASVALTFVHVLPGRRVGGNCVAPNGRNRTKARCKRDTTAGSLPLSGHAGTNKIRFQGRLSQTKKLTPGSYTASVTTRDAHGLKTLTRSLSFTIVP